MVKFFSLNSEGSSWRHVWMSLLIGCTGTASPLLTAQAQEALPWQRAPQYQQQQHQQPQYQQRQYQQPGANQTYQQVPRDNQRYAQQAPNPYGPANRDSYAPRRDDAYAPPPPVYNDQPRRAPNGNAPAYPQSGYAPSQPRHIQPYRPPEQYPRQYGSNDRYQPRYHNRQYDDRNRYDDRRTRMPDGGGGTYSQNEVVDAGHRFFGSLSTGLAKAIQWAFKRSGRPNGYILGEDAGGAFVAGLRYGEGKLFTKNHGVRRVFWQGPSIGYDFGGDGNRTMTLVYNLRSPRDVYRRFAGVQGSAYLVGGASVQFLTGADVTLAPIRTGVGLRLGANIGYLKFTRRPTWNPF